MILTGALINGAAIVAGGLVGTFGGRLMPQRMKETVLAATALISIGIGVSGLSSFPSCRWCWAPAAASC